MNLVEQLLAPSTPAGAPALLTLEREYTYGELREAVDRVCGFVLERGASKGDCVGLLAENSFFAVVAYLGVIQAGCVAVPLGSHLTPEHFGDIAQSTGMKLAFAQSSLVADYGQSLRLVDTCVVEGTGEVPWEGAVAFASLGPASASRSAPAIDEDKDLAALLFTSGSTSRPRGVMLTHRNILANTASILSYLELTPADRVMVVLPFYYSFGASLLHTHLQAGASLVIDKRFMYPDKVLTRMQQTRCTGFAGVPSHFQILLRKSKLKSMSFPDLRWLQQAGGKLADPFIEELSASLPQAKLFIMYGATEATARICCLPPALLPTKRGSIGKAIPGVTVHLLAEDGGPVAPGEVGEIVVEGKNVSEGYFQDPAESAGSFRNGRLHTGDLARKDAEGFLFIVGRNKDFLKCGGSRTSAKALEEALLAFPDAVEVAVLGVPDGLLGEAVAAFVVPRSLEDSTFQARFLSFATQALPPQLVPKQVTVLTELPKSAGGKVLKSQLRGL